MPYNIRYVSANSTPGGDGSTTGTAGATRAWTINECLTRLSGAVEHRILNDGVHVITGNITLAAGLRTGTGRVEVVGYDSVTLTPLIARYNQSGRIDHNSLARISVSSGFNITNGSVTHLTWQGLLVSGFVNNVLLNWNNGNQGSIFNHTVTINTSTGFVARGVSLFNANYLLNSEVYCSGDMAVQANGLASNIIYNCYLEAARHGANTVRDNVWVNNVVVARQGYGIFAGATNSSNFNAWFALGNTISAPSGAFGLHENYTTSSGVHILTDNVVLNSQFLTDRVTTAGVRSTGTNVLSAFIANNAMLNTPVPTGTDSIIGESIKINSLSLSGTTFGFLSSGTYAPRPATTGIDRRGPFNSALGAVPPLVSRYIPEING